MCIYLKIIFKNLPYTASLVNEYARYQKDIKVISSRIIDSKHIEIEFEFKVDDFDKMQHQLLELILYATKKKLHWTEPINIVKARDPFEKL